MYVFFQLGSESRNDTDRQTFVTFSGMAVRAHAWFDAAANSSNLSAFLNTTDVTPATDLSTLSTDVSADEDVPAQDPIAFIEERVALYLWVYVSPVLILIGTAGNCLSILVFSQRELRSKSTSVYFMVLGVADTVVLYAGLLRHWVDNTFGIDIRLLGVVGCKIHLFLVYMSMQYSAWTLVAVTFERFVSVVFPFHSQTVCKRRNALICLGTLTVLLCTLNLHFFWTKTIGYSEYAGKLWPIVVNTEVMYKEFFNDVWNLLDVMIASVIPFLLMLICNITIIVRLQIAMMKRRGQMNVQQKDSGPRMTTMTAMLLAISFIFLCTTGPLTIYLTIRPYLPRTEFGTRPDSQRHLLFTSLSLLAYVNNTVNFFLYCITGAKFRHELKSLFRCTKKKPAAKYRDSTYLSTISQTSRRTTE